MSPSDLIALASLFVALAALAISIYAISRANRTASAATLVTLNEGFRQAWDRYLQARTIDDLAELLNLLEIACAMFIERSLTGNSRILAREYIKNVLSILARNPEVSEQAVQLLQTPDTFRFIKRFMKERPAGLSVVMPPAWYQLQD